MSEMRPIPGYPNYYITMSGDVYSSLKTIKGLKYRKLKGSPNNQGYPTVGLTSAFGVTHYGIHRLVMETYQGPCPFGMEVRHLDGNKLNSHFDNLVYGTPKQNANDNKIHGVTIRGEQHGSAVLTEEIVKNVKEDYATGTYTYADLDSKYGLPGDHSGGYACRLVRGQLWGHVAPELNVTTQKSWKLNEEKIEWIKKTFVTTTLSMTDIAKQASVSIAMVSMIIRGLEHPEIRPDLTCRNTNKAARLRKNLELGDGHESR